MIAIEDLSALVLCGGQGSRFGFMDKPLVPYHGALGPLPMVDYVVERLPQTTEVLISANRNINEIIERISQFEKEVEADCTPKNAQLLIAYYNKAIEYYATFSDE